MYRRSGSYSEDKVYYNRTPAKRFRENFEKFFGKALFHNTSLWLVSAVF